MTFLNHAYSLLPLIYFGQLEKDANILIVTDHPERAEIDFSLFPFSVYFCVPGGHREAFIDKAPGDIQTWEPQELPHKAGMLDLVVIDLEHTVPDIFLQQAGDLLKSHGRVITLDWSFSRLYTMINLPFHMGWRRQPAGRFKDAVYWIKRAGLEVEWYFLPEPDLRKPRFLVKPGFHTRIPSFSRSGFRQRLKEWGVFYLKPRHKVIVAAENETEMQENTADSTDDISTDNLISDIIRPLLGGNKKPAYYQKAIKQFYISTTNVLTIQVSKSGKAFFIRFPYTNASHQRMQNQLKLTNFLRKSDISWVPNPIREVDGGAYPVFVEEGLPGRNIEREFSEMNPEEAKFYYEKVQETMMKLHLRFGHILEMDSVEFDRHIGMRLDAISGKLDNADYEKPIGRIREYFQDELLGKNLFASICHGDLKIGNCLFDEDAQITGIIDWDMGEEEGLTLVDVCSLLARSIRQRKRLSLAELVLELNTIPGDFLPLYHYYFEQTKTTLIPLFTALLFYWTDRVYKQITFDPHIREEWIQRNVVPVLENIEDSLSKTRFAEGVEK